METKVSKRDEINEKLAAISSQIYEGMELRLVDVGLIDQIDKNARFMDAATFGQLKRNIERDGKLESVPLLSLKKNGRYECISGNHRCMAAKETGIKEIIALVITKEISLQEKRAKQLSHNAITGKDDKSILKQLWEEIDSIEFKEYSGLDSETVKELEKIAFSAMTTPSVKSEVLVLLFTEPEVTKINEIIEALKSSPGKLVFANDISLFEDFFEKLLLVKEKYDIRNTSVAFMKMLEILHKNKELNMDVVGNDAII